MTPIEEIKSKLNILDIVSNYIRVERSGAQYKAKCPFHNERTPSFYISLERGSYHCFGCQAHGDIFGFIENIEHIPFVESLKMLADRAGVSLSSHKKKQDEGEGRLIDMLTIANEKYGENLKQSVEAKDYLLSRGLNEISINNFAIGYAKNEWRDIFIYLSTRGYTPEEMVAGGLVIKTDDGKYYDRFRGRIMFPIYNISNALVGYTGRILPVYDDGKTGKYINTPETVIYHKSNILYNYNKAKKKMAETGEIVLVEGQMDVVMSTQAGIENVIAVSGTAFTEYHVKMIKRLVDKVIMSFDNDKAGMVARDKAIHMCLVNGLEVYLLAVNAGPSPSLSPQGRGTKINVFGVASSLVGRIEEGPVFLPKDAADIVQSSPAIWRDMVANSIHIFDYFIIEARAYTEAKARIEYIRKHILESLYYIDSPLARNQYMSHVATSLAIDISVLKDELARLKVQDKETSSPDKSKSQEKKNNPFADISLQLAAVTYKLDIKTNKNVDSPTIIKEQNGDYEKQQNNLNKIEYPVEMLEGVLLYLESMGVVDYDLLYKELSRSVDRMQREEKLNSLSNKLKLGGLSDTETLEILTEMNRLKRG